MSWFTTGIRAIGNAVTTVGKGIKDFGENIGLGVKEVGIRIGNDATNLSKGNI